VAIEILPARLSDASEIAFTSRLLIEHGFEWSWTPTRVARAIRHPETEVIAAKEDGRILGFAIMRLYDEHAHLFLLGVRTESQRRGIGTQLLEWLEELARAALVGTIRLEVRAKNRSARAFYRSLGYLEIGVAQGYYSGREDAIRMTASTKTRESMSRRR
jgi:ribosomal-protein-alanine N-acetyltransferase